MQNEVKILFSMPNWFWFKGQIFLTLPSKGCNYTFDIGGLKLLKSFYALLSQIFGGQNPIFFYSLSQILGWPCPPPLLICVLVLGSRVRRSRRHGTHFEKGSLGMSKNIKWILEMPWLQWPSKIYLGKDIGVIITWN